MPTTSDNPHEVELQACWCYDRRLWSGDLHGRPLLARLRNDCSGLLAVGAAIAALDFNPPRSPVAITARILRETYAETLINPLTVLHAAAAESTYGGTGRG